MAALAAAGPAALPQVPHWEVHYPALAAALAKNAAIRQAILAHHSLFRQGLALSPLIVLHAQPIASDVASWVVAPTAGSL